MGLWFYLESVTSQISLRCRQTWSPRFGHVELSGESKNSSKQWEFETDPIELLKCKSKRNGFEFEITEFESARTNCNAMSVVFGLDRKQISMEMAGIVIFTKTGLR